MEHISILVIDDEPAVLETLTSFLGTLHSFTCVPVTSAEEAISELKEQSFDLILSDVRMGGMDGYKLLSILRREYPEIPVILITGFSHDYDEGIALGAKDFVGKPFDLMALKARIHLVLQNARLMNELQKKNQALEESNQALEESNRRLREERDHLIRLVDSWLTQGVDDLETRTLLTEILMALE